VHNEPELKYKGNRGMEEDDEFEYLSEKQIDHLRASDNE